MNASDAAQDLVTSMATHTEQGRLYQTDPEAWSVYVLFRYHGDKALKAQAWGLLSKDRQGLVRKCLGKGDD